MKNLYFFILFSISFLMTSCGEDDPCQDIICQNEGICNDGKCDCPDGFEGDLCQEKKLLLKSISVDGRLDMMYEYNEDRNIIKEIEFASISPLFEYTYEYKSDSIFAHGYHFFQDNYYTFKYNLEHSGQLKSEFFDSGVSVGFYNIYSQLDEACGYNKLEFYSNDGILQSKRTTNFIDENCSINQKRINKITNSLMYSVVTENDDKNYYKESTEIIYFKSSKRGNPIHHLVKDENGDAKTAVSFNSTYTFNDYDYPSKETREYYDGKVEIRTFEYY